MILIYFAVGRRSARAAPHSLLGWADRVRPAGRHRRFPTFLDLLATSQSRIFYVH
jgi:hypothetical protein